MKPLVIFGAGATAELAGFYFEHDGGREVAAYTVDRDFVPPGADTFAGKPLHAFEDVPAIFPPCSFDFFVAVGYTKLNQARREKCEIAQAAGYTLASYVSSRATVWPGFSPGWNCLILEDNTIQPFVTIGNNVTLWSGNHIGHHSSIADNVFVASQAVISGGVTVENNCFIGVNVTVRDGVKVGAFTVLGAGALLLEDSEPYGVYAPRSTERARVPSNRLRGI